MTKMTKEHLAQVIAETEQWLDDVDPATLVWEDPADLRRVGIALRDLGTAEAQLRGAVVDARANGRSWAEIGIVLGVSKQGAQQRFSH